MRFSFIILLCCSAFWVRSQTGSNDKSPDTAFLHPVSLYNGSVKQFTADNLGNVYVLTSAGLLIMLNSRGDSLNVFNDVRSYGTVYAIDATNPMKVLLYYKNFSTVLMLDRYLNRINMIDLRKSAIFQAKAIGLSYDNNVWVFDEQSAKLKKVDDTGRLLSETADLRQVLDIVPSPHAITDRDGFVYVYDSTKGLYIFDYYGTLKNTLPLTGLTDLQVIGKTMVGRRQNKLVRYTLGTLELQEEPLPGVIQNAQKIYITQQGIYVLDESGIEMYPYH